MASWEKNDSLPERILTRNVFGYNPECSLLTQLPVSQVVCSLIISRLDCPVAEMLFIMKSTKVRTHSADHAIVHTEHLLGGEDTRHHLQ